MVVRLGGGNRGAEGWQEFSERSVMFVLKRCVEIQN